MGNETNYATQGSSAGKVNLKTSGCKNLWGLQQQEKRPASQGSSLERPAGSYNVHKTTHPGMSTEGPNLLVGSRGSDQKLANREQASLFPLFLV